MPELICEISASNWFYYKEIFYGARSHERKKDGLKFRAEFSGASTDVLARMGFRKINLTECKPKISKELLNSSYRIRNNNSIRHIGFVIIKCQNMSFTSLHSNNSHYRMD
jgi:hypothetical protein